MNRYSYEGPIMVFGRCVQNNWKSQTMAPTEKRARSNLAYQWKKQNGQLAGAANVVLPGKLLVIDIGGN